MKTKKIKQAIIHPYLEDPSSLAPVINITKNFSSGVLKISGPLVPFTHNKTTNSFKLSSMGPRKTQGFCPKTAACTPVPTPAWESLTFDQRNPRRTPTHFFSRDPRKRKCKSMLQHVIQRREEVLGLIQNIIQQKQDISNQLEAIKALDGEKEFKLACINHLGQRIRIDEQLQQLEKEAAELAMAKARINQRDEEIRYGLQTGKFNLIWCFNPPRLRLEHREKVHKHLLRSTFPSRTWYKSAGLESPKNLHQSPQSLPSGTSSSSGPHPSIRACPITSSDIHRYGLMIPGPSGTKNGRRYQGAQDPVNRLKY